MKIKSGVKINDISTEILLAAVVAESVWKRYGVEDGITITSCRDGKHMENSKHYSGEAIDLRTWNLPSGTSPQDAAETLSEALGDNFDVVVEPTHIHVEYDPEMGSEEV